MLEAHEVQCLVVQHLAGAKQTILIHFLLGNLLSPKNLSWTVGLSGREPHFLLFSCGLLHKELEEKR